MEKFAGYVRDNGIFTSATPAANGRHQNPR